jgi:hypothetical protein
MQIIFTTLNSTVSIFYSLILFRLKNLRVYLCSFSSSLALYFKQQIFYDMILRDDYPRQMSGYIAEAAVVTLQLFSNLS